MRTAISVLCLCISVSLADALTLRNYLQMRDSGDETAKVMLTAYISGLGNGVFTANVTARTQHGRALYCEPLTLTMNSENFRTILDKSIKKRQETGYTHGKEDIELLGILLMFGLQDTFPCPK